MNGFGMTDRSRTWPSERTHHLDSVRVHSGLVTAQGVISEFEPAFAHLTKEGAGALQVCGAPYFFSRRQHLVALAARYRVPTIYESRQFVDAAAPMSMSASGPCVVRGARICWRPARSSRVSIRFCLDRKSADVFSAARGFLRHVCLASSRLVQDSRRPSRRIRSR
jgi:hypothetical protein